ncbi:MAG: heparinase II/III family protein [Bacteroides sp.]|nr:heparinase II/III family protein [Bacteroides sp.]
MNYLVKKLLYIICLICTTALQAQQLRPEIFSLIDLNYPGLEQVRSLHQEGNDVAAAEALLAYYRQRSHINHPEVNLNNVTISKQEQQWADDALEHTFFVHKGYQPSYNYGKDINWQYWPIKDNELRWQLHRHKWFSPMGKAYRVTGDEKYARAWVHQYMDWILKNPLTGTNKQPHKLISSGEVKRDAENARFAWRPLEVSHRLQDQTGQFLYFLSSPSFTPEFLTEFLVNYHRHALHISANYSDTGNHLLFEAQRMIYAGAFFPEFKEAGSWRKSSIEVLNREIHLQVYPDGGHFELDPHYHLAAINIFCKALFMADVNGFRNEFPATYLDTVENMILFYMNICFPDYTNPCFSDAKLGDRKNEQKNYLIWNRIFPDNQQIRYMGTAGKEGVPPHQLSRPFKHSGFFVFRNSWKEEATIMVLKAGPKGFWHCQPDNGTFELWFNGRNLFPDSGAYVYAGNEVMELRNWFRQTRVHNTLTLDGRNLETTESVCLHWQGEGEVQTLVTENPSYEGLRHRRTVFFVDNTYFVVVDEAIGNATGEVNLNYQLCEGEVKIDADRHILLSQFEGDSNVKLQCFAEKGTTLREEEGWRSTAYRQRVERTAVSFNTPKKQGDTTRFITVIYPVKDAAQAPQLSAKFTTKKFSENRVDVEVKVDNKSRKLSCEWQRDLRFTD